MIIKTKPLLHTVLMLMVFFSVTAGSTLLLSGCGETKPVEKPPIETPDSEAEGEGEAVPEAPAL